MGQDITPGHTYDETESGRQVTYDNLNRLVSDASLKETAISARTARTSPSLSDQLLISDGALKRVTAQALATLITANPDAKVITDRTEESAIANGDYLLVYDASAAALRKCTRDQLLPSGAALKVIQATLSTNQTVTAAIPSDNTIPQITEGTQILSQAITPPSSSDKILCRVNVPYSSNTAIRVGVALFRTGNSNALAAVEGQSGNSGMISFEYLDSPASASEQTYSIRVGNTDGASTVGINGQASSAGTRIYGGACMATLTLIAIKG